MPHHHRPLRVRTSSQADDHLLRLLFEHQGWLWPICRVEAELNWNVIFDSEVPGICRDDECNAISPRCESDVRYTHARGGSRCHACGGQTVVALDDLFLDVYYP